RGYLSRQDLLSINGLKQNPLGTRIADAFINKSVDENGLDDTRIDFEHFVRGLARFRPLSHSKPNMTNSREEKLRFSFSMCDLDNDGFITHEEFKMVLQAVVGDTIPADKLNDIVDRTMKEADLNTDSVISFVEFCKAMELADVEQRMSIKFDN
ncbi:EF-hand, partial [Aphelenchoides avenae]